jgi:hypothetical protein
MANARQTARFLLIIGVTALVVFFVASLGIIFIVNGVVYELIRGATHTTPPPHGRLIPPSTADLIGFLFAAVAALKMGQALRPTLGAKRDAGSADGPLTNRAVGQPPRSLSSSPSFPPRPPLPSPSSTTGPTNVSTPSVADELAKFAELKAAGVLTQTEFDTQKTKLLSQ